MCEYMYICPQRTEESLRSHGAGDPGCSKLPDLDVFSPLEEQQVPVTTEPPFQPHEFEMFSKIISL